MSYDDPARPARPVAPDAGGRPSDAAGPAWLLRDVTHVPGVLTLRDGRLRFVSTRRVVFDATPDELDLVVSRARRGLFRLTVDGERLGLSVVRPSGAVPVPDDLLARTPGADSTAPADAPSRWQGLLGAGAGERRRVRRAGSTGGSASRARRRADPRRRRALRALTTLVPGRRRAVVPA